jgi:hypothetical protein
MLSRYMEVEHKYDQLFITVVQMFGLFRMKFVHWLVKITVQYENIHFSQDIRHSLIWICGKSSGNIEN